MTQESTAPTPTSVELCATFIDTGKTVVHRGRTFKILNPPASEKRNDSPYILHSGKGDYYALTRNRPKSHLLFGIALYGGRLRCLPGWFSDQNGELKSLG